ncbi:hypothetical protein LDE05_14410 [Lactobacillus delbrueckii subsp. bulgaricus]|nr:hypothetical protein IV47_GL001109 [Lactobacillus delbrueckii subsp. bulgaricus ATCC 11842 = JCM 1002]GEB91578.1 hypothetical protein LDE05_14410 [Lactobacillus delbrueckii subsp. bulgaricus]
MKWFKRILLLGLVLSCFLTTACSNLTKEANQKDTWAKIKKRGSLVIGLDDTFVPMDFRQKRWPTGRLQRRLSQGRVQEAGP